jgi:starvation-inducible DNA-binding protein
MATTTQTALKRDVMGGAKQAEVADILQGNLVNLIDLALLAKQAHWNVLGPNFRSIHLQLDEITDAVREASDEVAERITTLGITADGRSETVAGASQLSNYPGGFQSVPDTVTAVADGMKTTIDALRSAIEKLGEIDPISEDLLIGISGGLEKQLWMLQAQEVHLKS